VPRSPSLCHGTNFSQSSQSKIGDEVGLRSAATSGEYAYRVAPLEVPTPGEKEPGHILGHSSVELFIARATALQSDFSVQTDTLPYQLVRSAGASTEVKGRMDSIPEVPFCVFHGGSGLRLDTAKLAIRPSASPLDEGVAHWPPRSMPQAPNDRHQSIIDVL
jgi:hypothetical protein